MKPPKVCGIKIYAFHMGITMSFLGLIMIAIFGGPSLSAPANSIWSVFATLGFILLLSGFSVFTLLLVALGLPYHSPDGIFDSQIAEEFNEWLKRNKK